MKIVDAVQIAANAGWPNAPNREGTGFANIAEEFTSALKLISEDWRASECAEKDGNAFFGGSGPCVHQDSRRCLFIPVARRKNRPDVSKRFETGVSATERFGAMDFLGLWTPDRASIQCFRGIGKLSRYPPARTK
jgi:hypothetical protein